MIVGVISVGVMTVGVMNQWMNQSMNVDLIKMLSLISLFLRFPSYFPQNSE
jgi:hypothetical protein